MEVIQVPARIDRALIDRVRTKMKGQGLQWSALVGFLFKAYLDGKIKIGVGTIE
jgi:hypothetical protein